ncbi:MULTISPECIES: hypothetical protein [Tindallia]|uniref:Uncharacterized protein n=2 Tax=Tindallia TaxID=69894 RepID=A0A1H3QIK2_9FIRM|nr:MULTISPECIES: hypothetical protein [Tindallia]SDZ13123.1 hypothetical protein SAMN05192546_109107 [Tindallia californiensis]SFI22792.1 hypothetical protein SAMN05192551_10941 [Tindallia magadiensis]
MKKLLVTGLLALLLISIQTTSVFATEDDLLPENQPNLEEEAELEEDIIEVVQPLRDVTTSRRNPMISFKAPEGSLVTLEVYHNASLLEEEENYLPLYEPMEFEIGALQRGWVDGVELKKGKNKLIFSGSLKEEALPTVERIITVKDREEMKEEVTRDVRESSTTDIMKRLINMGR